MERVVDRVMKHVASQFVNHVFMVTGGGAMFINDAVDKNKDINAVYLHHEQSCAMAAVAYGKTHRKFGVAVGTSGCGSTNMMTGLLDAWQDGVPCLFISGNANSDQIHERDERHYGVQDLDIGPIVRPITKAFFRIKDPEEVDKILNMAIDIMLDGNPGPVWIDIPIDIQGKEVTSVFEKINIAHKPLEASEDKVEQICNIIADSERPLILTGGGLGSYNAFGLVSSKIVSVETFGARKTGPIGRIGIKGDRVANLALYYADTIVCLGSSLSVPAIGYNLKDSMFHCKNLIVVDKECNKFKKRLYGSHIENIYFIEADASQFYHQISMFFTYPNYSKYLNKALKYKTNLANLQRLMLNEWSDTVSLLDNQTLNKFNIKDIVAHLAKPYNYVVADAGSAYYITSKVVRPYQKYIAPIAQAEMGAALPYAIGTYYATDEPVAVFTGDGSLQMNIQDLGALNGTEIDLYVLNNEGYLSIRKTQNKFFGPKTYGTEQSSGLPFPDLKQICDAYNVEYKRLYNSKKSVDHFMPTDILSSARVNEVMCNPHEDIYPRVEAKRNDDGSFTSFGFKNMYPFLSEEQIEQIEQMLEVE